jgi:death-on-curing protein
MPKSSINWHSIDITEVYAIHEAIIKRAGTKASVRDFALLHSACERPKASFQGQYLYPTIFSKAGALLQSLCMNHPFTDGNKRTAWMSTKRFLFLNGYHLQAETKLAVEFMIQVDNEKLELPVISGWLKKNSKKI